MITENKPSEQDNTIRYISEQLEKYITENVKLKNMVDILSKENQTLKESISTKDSENQSLKKRIASIKDDLERAEKRLRSDNTSFLHSGFQVSKGRQIW